MRPPIMPGIFSFWLLATAPMHAFTRTALAACSLFAVAAPAAAAEVYAGFGLPGVMLGFAQPVGSGLTVRGDIASLGSRQQDGVEEGINYTGKAKVQRSGLFGDWFPGSGGFRFTLGVTFNQQRVDLAAVGNGTPIEIGGTSYPTSTADRLDVRVAFPKTTPYVGIGYGHHRTEPGFGFVFDLGAQIGKAKVTAKTSGPNLSLVSQADLDQELAELRDGAGKVKAFPQLSLGVNYRF